MGTAEARAPSAGQIRAHIRLGLQVPSFNFPGVSAVRLFDRLAEIATTAEASGFDSLFVMDHLHQIDMRFGPRANWMLEGNTILIAPTHEAAHRTLRAVAPHAGMPADRLRAMITVVDPDTVAEQASELLDAGLDGLVFNMPNVHEPEEVALLGSTLSPLLAARAQGRS